jgi:hypothetical protein
MHPRIETDRSDPTKVVTTFKDSNGEVIKVMEFPTSINEIPKSSKKLVIEVDKDNPDKINASYKEFEARPENNNVSEDTEEYSILIKTDSFVHNFAYEMIYLIRSNDLSKLSQYDKDFSTGVPTLRERTEEFDFSDFPKLEEKHEDWFFKNLITTIFPPDAGMVRDNDTVVMTFKSDFDQEIIDLIKERAEKFLELYGHLFFTKEEYKKVTIKSFTKEIIKTQKESWQV